MKTAGIILIALEILGVVSALFITKDGIPSEPAQMLGYFAPGIIGLGLLFRGIEKEKQNKRQKENENK